MLQFNTTLCTTTARLNPRLWWRFTALFATNPTAAAPESANVSTKDKVASPSRGHVQTQAAKSNKTANRTSFVDVQQLLGVTHSEEAPESMINDKIQSAKTLNDLLDVLKVPNLSPEDNLRIMSTITKWVNSGNADLSDIQKDTRFMHLQRAIGSIGTSKKYSEAKDSEFVRYAKLSVPAMVKVISNLAVSKNRDTPLLRFLSQSIVEQSETLNTGQCSSLLYSSAVLNYIDEDLLEKIFSDLLQTDLSVKTDRLESIVTSMGILRYKNDKFLDYFCDCLLKSKVSFKRDRLMAILLTFATLGYTSQDIDLIVQKFMLPIKEDLNAPQKWLDFVWSLVILNKAESEHFNSVLRSTFIQKLKVTTSVTSTSKILKLLNINAAIQFALPDYDGPTIQSNVSPFDIQISRTNQKEMYISTLSQTLTNLLPSTSHFTMNVNTGMGFLIDAEIHLDSNSQPVPIKDSANSSDITRIAILMLDYNDYCRGKRDLLGIINFYNRALKSKGYRVLNISYEHFSHEDKLVKRVNYLKECIAFIQEQESV